MFAFVGLPVASARLQTAAFVSLSAPSAGAHVVINETTDLRASRSLRADGSHLKKDARRFFGSFERNGSLVFEASPAQFTCRADFARESRLKDGRPRITPRHKATRVTHPSLLVAPQSFADVLQERFPGTVSQEDFVQSTYEALSELGFTKYNSIPCVSLCRDEICKPLYNLLQETWTTADDPAGIFNMSSLGGMLFLGKTGLMAANSHSPQMDGVERYIYIAMPHIAVDEDGHIGYCSRAGRNQVSKACGALIAFQQELSSGAINVEMDDEDIEQSLLKQKLLRRIRYGNVPDLADLTKVAMSSILESLESAIRHTVDPQRANYAVLTGIQIHGPQGEDYVFPAVMYAQVNNQRFQIDIPRSGITHTL